MEVMKPILDRVDTVLFDLDGTLVDTNIDFPLMKRRMLALASSYGIDTSGLADLDILAIVHSAAEMLDSEHRPDDARALHDECMSALEEIELHHAAETLEVPCARELLDGLRSRGVRIGIVTRNCRAASLMSLRRTGIEPDVLICREDAQRQKPHPEQLLKALLLLDGSAANSVMVGDHLMDVLSGKAAGVKTIGFLRDSRPDDFFVQVEPDLVVRSLSEVLDAIVHRDR